MTEIYSIDKSLRTKTPALQSDSQQRRRRWQWILKGAVVLLGLPYGLALAAATYKVESIAPLGSTTSIADNINNFGVAIGLAHYAGDPATHAFIFDNGQSTDLGTLGGRDAVAYGINDQNQVVGVSSTLYGNQHAFLYSNGTIADLGNILSAGGNSTAYAINNAAQIVGPSDTDSKVSPHAFLKDGNSVTDLGSFGGQSIAYDINNFGQVVGTSYTALNANSYAYLYTNGTMINLGTLGGSSSSAGGLNDLGQVVGRSNIAGDSASHAFVFANGMMSDLGTLGGASSSAGDINSSGQIVGIADSATATNLPFIYNGGVIQNINDLIDPASGWYITDLERLNDVGQITGRGCQAGVCGAIVLTPNDPLPAQVPEPAPYALMLAGLVLMSTAYRIQRPPAETL